MKRLLAGTLIAILIGGAWYVTNQQPTIDRPLTTNRPTSDSVLEQIKSNPNNATISQATQFVNGESDCDLLQGVFDRYADSDHVDKLDWMKEADRRMAEVGCYG